MASGPGHRPARRPRRSARPPHTRPARRRRCAHRHAPLQLTDPLGGLVRRGDLVGGHLALDVGRRDRHHLLVALGQVTHRRLGVAVDPRRLGDDHRPDDARRGDAPDGDGPGPTPTPTDQVVEEAFGGRHFEQPPQQVADVVVIGRDRGVGDVVHDIASTAARRRAPAPVDAGADGAHRDVERLGDLLVAGRPRRTARPRSGSPREVRPARRLQVLGEHAASRASAAGRRRQHPLGIVSGGGPADGACGGGRRRGTRWS